MNGLEWKTLLTQLSEPFAKEDVLWRAGQTTNDKKRAQALAYAEPRTYEDRLNQICLGDWSVKFTPWGDNRIICELTIHGVIRSSTGEYDEDKKNAMAEGTVAEAKAFKRACSKFGLGRYFYDLPLMWVDYDEVKKRLKETPEIPKQYLSSIHKQVDTDTGEIATLTPERAQAMSAKLEKLGYNKHEQLRLASSVLEKPITDLILLTDGEAYEVWSYAKRVHRQAS